MAKNAYLVVPDLHRCYKNLRSRFDYANESAFVYDQILSIARKYSGQGYSVQFLFLGDLFHNGYSDTFTAVKDNNIFRRLKDEFGSLYSVVGNHELSYYSNNPFFTLVEHIESERIKGITSKVWTPVGIENVIRVVDRLDDGEVHFYFNHNSLPVVEPDTTGINVGLFHLDLVPSEVKKSAEAKLGKPVWATEVDVEKSGILDKYKYCFFGHMHQTYGTYLLDSGTYLCYLGSLGRTSVAEVDDRFLERNVPAVLVEDGRFLTVESNKFNLLPRAVCVNEASVEMYEERYEEQKEKQEIREYKMVADDPVQNVVSALGSNLEATNILYSLLTVDQDAECMRILREADRFGN